MPRDRIKEIRSVKASELIANERNFRVHTDAQREAMTGILEEVGNVDVLKAIETDAGLKLIDGHLRRDLLADETVQVAVLDLSEEEARKVLLTFDRLGALATIDPDGIAALLADTVLDDARLNTMLAAWRDEIVIPEETDIGDDPGGDVPGNPDDAVSARGDVWVLGNHRLMCGDSSSTEDLDTLLAYAGVDLVNTDPPYNIKVEPRSNNAIAAGLSSFPMQDRKSDTRKKGDDHHQQLDLARHPEKAKATHAKLRPKDRPLENDFVTDAAFDALLESWFGNISRVLKKGGSFYIWGGYANCANYPPVLIKHKLYFAQAIIWIKEHPVLTRKDFMGNHEWCQPAGVQVLTPHGEVPIESLRDGDRVVSFSHHQNAMIGVGRGAPVTRTSRPYRGPLLGVAVGKQETWCTPGHLWTVRLAERAADMWCVYLMKKGEWWRAGKSKLITTCGFGVKQRLYTERGEAAWILSIHESSLEAALEEQIILAEYGIPLVTWSESTSSLRTISDISMLYERLDLDRMREGAFRALADHGRLLDYPLITDRRSRVKVSRRVSTLVRACNLLPGVMLVPRLGPNRSVRASWELVDAIDRQPFEGDVYSMDVAKHGHYVADGIVTHNCFYGWKEGAGHKFYGAANVTDTWSVKKVNPQSMIHLREKPVELAKRAIEYSSKHGDTVLDLFGGSGSTLIGAELTGRNARLMEIDTLYADVIVERWQTMTEKDATLEGTGQTFAEVRAERAESK